MKEENIKAENIKGLLKYFGELEQLLLNYNRIATEVMRVESDEIELITDKIDERNNLVSEMDKTVSMCTIYIDAFEPEESKLIRNMLQGKSINQRISDEFTSLKSAIVNLRSAQMQAAETDKALIAQFESRKNEAKAMLTKLKEDKKKLDYYASVNVKGNLGGDMDSSF